MRVSAQVKTNALKACAFLDYDTDGVNGFLVRQASRGAILSFRRAWVIMAPTCDNGARHAVAL